jgi:hypothetical protein
MTVLTRELEINGSAQDIWEHIADVASWTNWQQHVSESSWSDDAEPALGSRLRFRYSHNQNSPIVEAEVTGLRPGKEFSFKPVGGDLPYTEGMADLEWEWLLFPQRNGRTWLRFTLTYQADGGSPFFRELLGTRVQFLNFADSALNALRDMLEEQSMDEQQA